MYGSYRLERIYLAIKTCPEYAWSFTKGALMKIPQLPESAQNVLNKVPKTLSSVSFAITSFAMARNFAIVAQNCTINGIELSKRLLVQDGLKSSNKCVLGAFSVLSECSASYKNLGIFAIASIACGILAYNIGKEVIAVKAPKEEPKKDLNPKAKETDAESEEDEEEVSSNGKEAAVDSPRESAPKAPFTSAVKKK